MKRTLFYCAMAACFGLLLAPLVHAQSSNAGAAAGSLSGAQSQSGAVSGAAAGALSGSDSAAGSDSTSGASVIQTFEAPAAHTTSSTTATSTTNLNQNYSGGYTQRIENTPNAIAPNIYPSANCHGSSSAGGGIPGFGISIGTSWQDEDCQHRETARSFFQMGMKADAVAVLCASPFAKDAPACVALAPKPVQPVADLERGKVARDGDDTRRRTETYTVTPIDDTGPSEVSLPNEAPYNTGIIAASNGELWKKRDGKWLRVAVR